MLIWAPQWQLCIADAYFWEQTKILGSAQLVLTLKSLIRDGEKMEVAHFSTPPWLPVKSSWEPALYLLFAALFLFFEGNKAAVLHILNFLWW